MEVKSEPQAGFVLTQTQLQPWLMTVLRRFTRKSFAGIYAERIRAAMTVLANPSQGREQKGVPTQSISKSTLQSERKTNTDIRLRNIRQQSKDQVRPKQALKR